MTDVRDTLILEDDDKSVAKRKVISSVLIVLVIALVGTMIGYSVYYDVPHKHSSVILSASSLADSAVQITKAKIDNANYNLITLKDGQEVLLIQDPDTTKLGAAVSVHTGSLTDFFKYEGLAHMAEHAMFGGSDKYDINELLSYCDKMGGDINAETSDEYTSYMFEMVTKDSYETALDILAHQVLYPKFDEQYVFGEAYNVNSEYINSYELDDEKMSKILKANSRKDGPFYQLTVGTYKTLREGKTQDEFLATIRRYYTNYYKPKHMKLVLRANQNFEYLQKKAEDFFNTKKESKTSNLQREPPKPDDNPEERYHDINAFPSENRQRLIWWKQNSSSSTANFVFYIDLKDKDTLLINPHVLIQYHLKNFGEGSFIDSLINEKLAINLTTDTTTLFSDFTLLYIKIELTTEGLNKVVEIGKRLFSYIHKIKSADNTDLVEEIKKNASKRFDFTEKDPDIFDAITSNTINMHFSDKASILNRDFNFTKHTKEAQAAFFKYLTPEYLILLVGTKDDINLNILNLNGQTVWTESQYQTKYAFRNLSSDEISAFNNAAANYNLRSTNKYSTTSDALLEKKDCDLTKQSILSTASAVLDYVVNTCYRTPKVAGKVEITFDTTGTDNDVFDTVLEVINSKLLLKSSDFINSLIDAGNDASISFDGSSLLLDFNIFSDTVYSALNDYLDNIISKKVFVVDDDLFEIYKLKAKNDLLDTQYDEPKTLADTYFDVLTSDNKLPKERAFNVDNLKLDDFNKTLNLLKNQLRVKLLLVGDVKLEKLDQIKTILQANFKGTKGSEEGKTYKVIEPSAIVYQTINTVDSNTNSAIANYYRVNDDSTDSQKKNSFITQIVVKYFEGKYFNILRTEKKLGYFVRSNYHSLNGDSYIVLQLMGSQNNKNPESNPEKFDSEFDNLTKILKSDVFDKLNENDEKLPKFKESLIGSLTSIPLTLADKVESVWPDVDFPDSGRRLDENSDKELINSISIQQVKDMFNDLFFEKARKLSVRIFASNTIPQDKSGNYNLNDKIKKIVTEDLNYLKTTPSTN